MPFRTRAATVLLCQVFLVMSGCTFQPPANPNESPTVSDIDAPPLPPGEVLPSSPRQPPPPPSGNELAAPTGAAETVIITKEGGTIASPDGQVEITVPENAVETDTTVTLREVPSDSLPGPVREISVGPVFRLEPVELMPLRPLQVKVKLNLGNVSNTTAPRIPLLLPSPLDDTGANVPVQNATETIDVRSGTLEIAFATGELGYMFLEDAGLSARLNPYDVTAFIADPWTASVSFSSSSVSGFEVTNLTAEPFDPVLAHEKTLPASIMDATPAVITFECGTPGYGSFGVSFDTRINADEELHVLLFAPAYCVEDPALTAQIIPPKTLFEVHARLPGGGEGASIPARIVYAWRVVISCGVFEADGNRTVGTSLILFWPSGPEASWEHPNAPAPPPDLSTQDANGDRVPDYCKHSEVPNFSHPGEVSVVLYYRRPAFSDADVEGAARIDATNAWGDESDPLYGGQVVCTRSGSLTGSGTCQGFVGVNLLPESSGEEDQ